MFPTISADSGITITDTEPGISMLASGFVSPPSQHPPIGPIDDFPFRQGTVAWR